MSEKNLKFNLIGEDVSASKTIEHVETVGQKAAGKIGGAFGKLGTALGGEFGEVFSKVGEGFDKLGESGGAKLGAKLAVGGAAATGAGMVFMNMGAGIKQSTDQLKQSISDVGLSYSDYKEEIEKTVKSQENFGHNALETQRALATLTTATGDPTKAMDMMGLAANLAAARHISLQDATDKLTQVLGGKGTKTLAQFGISAKDAAGHTKTVQEKIDELSKKVDGQASASMDNFRGKIDIVKTKVADWADELGTKVGPAITAVGPVLMGVGAVMESGLVPKLATAALKFLGMGAAATESAAAVDVAAADTAIAEVGVEATSTATGIATALAFLPIILAVAAVALAAYELHAHWKAIWGEIKTIAVDAWHWAEDIFKNKITQSILAVVAPILFLAIHWRDTWAVIKTVGQDAYGFLRTYVFIPISTAVSAVGTTLGRIVGFVAGMPAKIAIAAVGMFDGIKDAFRAAINFIISGWNGLQFGLDIPHKVMGIPVPGGGGHVGFGVPQIPLLAMGGVVTKATQLIAGEAGPEAIIPLSKAGHLLGGGGKAGSTIHVHLGLVYGNADTAAREILTALQRLKGQGVQVQLG